MPNQIPMRDERWTHQSEGDEGLSLFAEAEPRSKEAHGYRPGDEKRPLRQSHRRILDISGQEWLIQLDWNGQCKMGDKAGSINLGHILEDLACRAEEFGLCSVDIGRVLKAS